MPYRDRKIPLVILQDASDSTKYIKGLLDERMRQLIGELKRHPYTNELVLMAAQYDDQYYQRTPFVPLSGVSTGILDLKAPCGATNTGGAILSALRSLKERLEDWDKQGIPYSCPVFLLMTDGPVSPGLDTRWTDQEKRAMKQRYNEDYQEAAHWIKLLETSGELTFGAVGIVHSSMYRADMEELSRLTNQPDSVMEARVRFNSELELEEVIQWVKDAVTGSGSRQHRYKDISSHKEESCRKNSSQRTQQQYRTHNGSRGMQCDDVTCDFFDLNRS